MDPRFLDEDTEKRAQELRRRRRLHLGDDWHPAYRIVVGTFPVPDTDDQFFVVRSEHTAIYDRTYAEQQAERTKAWELEQIARRTRRLECLRPLPPVTISGDKMNAGFHDLHAEYPDARGDLCPHRGYDLTSIPIDADGCRRCPIHQLKVQAPRRREEPAARQTRGRGFHPIRG